MGHQIFFFSVTFITLVAFRSDIQTLPISPTPDIQTLPPSPTSGADREITANIQDSCLLTCPLFGYLRILTIDWYRCSPENGPCNKYWSGIPIAEVKNMTEKIIYYPNLDIDTDGALVIKKLLPMDDGVMFICYATKAYVERKKLTTILNIVKGPPKLIPLCPPVIHVIEGMDLHIDATVLGYPYPWVAWSHNKVVIGNKSIENNEASHIIRNVTVYEGGSYSCFANNRYEDDEFTVNVYVQEKSCTPTQTVPDFSHLHPSQKVMTTVASSIPSPPSSPTPEEKAPANCEVPCWSIAVFAAFLVLTFAIIICLGVCIKKRLGENKVAASNPENIPM